MSDKIYDFTKLRLILNREFYTNEFINSFIENIKQLIIGTEVKNIDYNYKNITISIPKNQNNELVIKRNICNALYKTLNIHKLEISSRILQERNNSLSDLLINHIFIGNYIHLLLDIFIFTYDELVIRIDL